MVDFRNTIIIMTSNIGTSAITSTSFGFKSKSSKEEDNYTDIMTAVKKFFIPEFLNRIDEVIVFNALTKEDLYEIISLQLEDLRANITILSLIENEILAGIQIVEQVKTIK